MKKRIGTALALLLVFVPIYFYGDSRIVAALVLLLSYGLFWESYRMTYGSQYAIGYAVTLLSTVGILGAFWGLQSLFFLLLACVAFFWGLRMAAMLLPRQCGISPRTWMIAQGFDIALLGVSLWLGYLQAKLFLFQMLVGVCGIDSVSYFVGQLWGKHRMFPTISPKKTWEGYIGGLAWNFLYGSIILIPKEISILTLTLFLCMVYILAITGDLLVSNQKRLLDVKDSGALLPGHGGLLDRFDSWMFVSALVCYRVIIN